MTVNSSNREKSPKLLMFKSSHDVILKKSKVRNYPQIFLNRPGTPSIQEAEAGEFVRPRPIAVYIENLDSKTNQTNTQNVFPGLMVQTYKIPATWKVMAGGSQVQGLPGLSNKFKAQSFVNLLRNK